MTNTTDMTVTQEIKAEIGAVIIPEEYDLKIHEAAAIAKPNIDEETLNAIVTAFKLGFKRGKVCSSSGIDFQFLDDMETDLRSAAAQIVVLDTATGSDDAVIPQSIQRDFLFGLSNQLEDLVRRFEILEEKL